MQEIPRALLLPPPSSTQRSSARGAYALEQDLPVETERGARRASPPASHFLTLVDTRREDSVEFSAEARGAKQFRFRPYTNRGSTAEHNGDANTIERPSAGELAEPDAADGQVARTVLNGFASGDGSRNSSAFLASLISQEQLSEGLYDPPYGEASDAYRRAGGSPPVVTGNPRVISFAA